MDTMSIPDLVTALSKEAPVDSTTAYVKASDVKQSIINSVLRVDNLIAMASINSTGGQPKRQLLYLPKTGPKI